MADQFEPVWRSEYRFPHVFKGWNRWFTATDCRIIITMFLTNEDKT